ncbi:plasmid mobilization relaxosome protein MobC, partial [Proteus mirabilis]
LRSLSLNEKTKKIKPVDPQLLYELNRIGVNLNQIARYCNQQAIFQAEDKIDLLATLANIEEQLQALRESHAS